MRKLIDLEDGVIAKLEKMAVKDSRKVKPFIEGVLIDLTKGRLKYDDKNSIVNSGD